MKVGVTGHQARDGIDWSWVEHAVRNQFSRLVGVTQALSSLAPGSDQVFANVAIELKIPVLGVLPMPGYDAFFEGAARTNYRRLLKQCTRFDLPGSSDPEQAFLEAGKYIVDNCDTLFAIWDGAPPGGAGGTADVVNYAQRRHRVITHMNPINGTILRL